ncbi:hypothetical protein [Devosia geojensis]|uniref:hypothetical protein n=1 Tax=Devosia geojensis TaxID=443610 RepID=UPI000A4CDE49|nr:hypothetical protein [Devosia geojensis]
MQTYDPHKNTKEVRQGSTRWMNTRVLVISTIAVVLAFALIYVWFFIVGSN